MARSFSIGELAGRCAMDVDGVYEESIGSGGPNMDKPMTTKISEFH